MKAHPRIYRSVEIERIRRGLERYSFPRLQMMTLVVLTGASGLLASFLLLHAGMVHMWLRYLAAFGVAYLVFLALLWLWLLTREEHHDAPDLSNLPSSGSGGSGDGGFSGGGGHFGGGGASGSFDGSGAYLPGPEAPALDVPLGDAGGAAGDVLGSAGDALGAAGEAALPLAAVLAIVALISAIVGSSLFMVYSAPELFAELLVDGVLSASLYHKLRGLHTRHWLETAIHRTAWRFLLAAVIVSAAGWAMARYAPEAHTLGEVIYHAKHRG